MRILICDDDVLMIEKISTLIKNYFESFHIKCPAIIHFTDGSTLLADMGEKDILFLDIEMPGMNGIYVGNELKKKYKDIIIFVITSYPEYLDDAMRFHVFRYLSKPIDELRFFRNMTDALYHYNTINTKIAVETKQDVHVLPVSSIVAIEAIARKVIVHTTAQDFESIHTMQYWFEQLPSNLFFQTHRSFIVNYAHVVDFDHTTIHLTANHLTAYLTRRKYTAFKESYLLYLESTR